jgi:trehalose 6-phosphate phosphatase
MEPERYCGRYSPSMAVQNRNGGVLIPEKSDTRVSVASPRGEPPLEAIDRRFSFERSAILLDIDGTLLDLAPTPAGVLVPSSLQTSLLSLWKWTGGALALVSGRALSDIDRVFAPIDLPAIGGHGAEIRPLVTDEKVVRRPLPLVDERLRRRVLALGAPGILIEDKGYSLAVHYRLAPERAPALRKAIAEITHELESGTYEILPGKAVVEIKPTGFNKGSAVLELMEMEPFKGRTPIFVGDDVTDEAVFAILADVEGIGISVGRPMAGARACFDQPADVRAWLKRLAARAPE